MVRRKPNILVTGTPGVGKSSLCSQICEITGLKCINISKFAIENNLTTEHDDDRDCDVIDEKKIVRKLRKDILKGGLVVEYHSCSFLPETWFDKVCVLRADIKVLDNRLKSRGYSELKIKENIQCEIFQIPLDEAVSTFGKEKVLIMDNDKKKNLKSNVKIMVNHIEELKKSLTKGQKY